MAQQAKPLHLAGIGQPLPHVHIVMQRKLRDFLADQDRIVAIKSDWLYKLCGPTGRERLVRAAGFTPVSPTPRPTTPNRRGGATASPA